MDIGESIWIVVKRVLDIPGMVYALLSLPLVLLFLGVLLSMRGYVRYFITWENALKDAADELGLEFRGVDAFRVGDSERRRAYLLKAVFKNLRLENLRLSGYREGIGFSLSFAHRSHRALDDQMLVETEFPSPLPVELLIRRRRSLADFLRDRKAILSGDADILDFVELDSPHMEAAERLLRRRDVTGALRKLYYYFPETTVTERGLRSARRVNINTQQTPDFAKMIPLFFKIATDIHRTAA